MQSFVGEFRHETNNDPVDGEKDQAETEIGGDDVVAGLETTSDNNRDRVESSCKNDQ